MVLVGYPLGRATPRQPWLRRGRWTALIWAARRGHLPSINALINSGAELNIQDKSRWVSCAAGGAGGVATAHAGEYPPFHSGARHCTVRPEKATPT